MVYRSDRYVQVAKRCGLGRGRWCLPRAIANLYSPAMPRPAMTSLLLALLLTGCARIDRTITVNSEPDNALVYLNDQEIGRTPVTRTFKWYGTYAVEVRKDGYQTVKTTAPVIAPWWQIPPIDLIAEFYPGKLEDNRTFQYSLHEPTTIDEDPAAVIKRGEQLRTRLESGQRTEVPQSRPTTRLSHHASDTPAPDTKP